MRTVTFITQHKHTTTHAHIHTLHDKHIAAARNTASHMLQTTSSANKPGTRRHKGNAEYKHLSIATTRHIVVHKHHCVQPPHALVHSARIVGPAKKHIHTHAALALHSRQSSQVAQRGRDAAGELVAVQSQGPAGHMNSHRITPWHPTLLTLPASRPPHQPIAAIAQHQSHQ
jgi:hypothetical protein